MMRALAAALAALALLVFAPSASAVYEPIGSGATKLTLEPSFLKLLRENGVSLKPQGGAKLKGGAASFPVTGGKLDPTSTNGTVEHGGALLFKGSKRAIPLKALLLKTTQRKAPFSAKLGGSQLKIASAPGLRVTRAGFAEAISVTKLRLSAKVAGRLNKKLRLRDVFAAGQPFARSKTQAVPVTVALKQAGKVSFAPDPAILAKLAGLFVALNPIAPAERPAEFTFPIFAGQLAPNASADSLATLGSLEALQLGGGQIFWREPTLDFEAKTLIAEVEVLPSPPYPGKQGAVPIAALDLAPAIVSSDPKARTISVAGARLALSAESAAAFNQAFAEGKAVFAAGEALGSVSFVATGQ